MLTPSTRGKHPDVNSRFFAEFIPHFDAGLRMTIVFAVVFVACNIFSQPFTKEEKEILELTDKRTLGKNKELLKYLNSGNPASLFLTSLGLANIGDSNTVDPIAGKLANPDKNLSLMLRNTLAFALGQINSQKSAGYLLKTIKENYDKPESVFLVGESLNNIGKIGVENDLSRVLGLQANNNFIKSRIALAIARFGMRRVKNEGSFTKLAELMQSTNDSTVHKYVSFAFNRIGDKPSLTPYRDYLLTLSSSYEPFTRMWSYSALGKLQDTSVVEKLLYELDIESDWRVRVNICNALGNQLLPADSPLREKVTASLLQHAIGDNSAHVSITALTALAKLYPGGTSGSPYAAMIKQELLKIINAENNSVKWQVKAEAIKTYAKMFKDEVKDELLALFSQADNYDIKAAVVGAFGSMNNAMVYKELRDSISADVMRYNTIHPNKDGSMIGSADLAKIYKAFVEALAELDDRLDDENKNIIRLIFSEFASSKHPAIVDVSLTNIQDSMYLKYRGETCQIMIFEYNGFEYPKDKDVMLMYIQAWDAMRYNGIKELLTKNLKHTDYDIAKASADALKNLTGKDYGKQITAPKYRHDFDWNFIDKLGDKKFAVIKTTQGDIKIELYPHIAPFTVQNFVKLGEKGFYNGTIFHRVVPNFVIQGGDPTGTGYGSPGYSIRSEFSPLPYDAYTLGMASSGMDTEGSQFFITHSPQPHLDGKYTLFGKVTEGFDVVDKIQIGDKVESVTFGPN